MPWKRKRQKRPANTLPDVIPGLVQRYREMIGQLAQLGNCPDVKTETVQVARKELSLLFGPIRVEPRGDVPAATPKINAAGIIRSTAAINRSFVVAGARFALFLLPRIWCV